MANPEETTTTFKAKVTNTMAQSMLGTSIGIGSRLGLFDLLAEADSPMTSQEIADKMKFKERYVREWLGSMVCGGIVEVQDDKYWLPPHRHAVMAGTNPQNVASFSWAIGMLAQVTDDLMDCFKLDGPPGLPYSKFPLFHDWREFRMNATYTWDMIKKKLLHVPGIIEKLEAGIEMAELGCSTGKLAMLLAEHFPKSTFYGYDISEEATDFANKKAKELGFSNVKFFVQDCCNMPQEWTNKWEYIMAYDLVHDVPQTTKVLKEICRVLKPGCVASIIDLNMHSHVKQNVSHPMACFVYTFSLFHCMTVSLAEEGGEGVGAAWGKEKAVEMFKQAGFTSVQIPPDQDFMYVHFLCSC